VNRAFESFPQSAVRSVPVAKLYGDDGRSRIKTAKTSLKI
jgi:hypothetical protein